MTRAASSVPAGIIKRKPGKHGHPRGTRTIPKNPVHPRAFLFFWCLIWVIEPVIVWLMGRRSGAEGSVRFVARWPAWPGARSGRVVLFCHWVVLGENGLAPWPSRPAWVFPPRGPVGRLPVTFRRWFGGPASLVPRTSRATRCVLGPSCSGRSPRGDRAGSAGGSVTAVLPGAGPVALVVGPCRGNLAHRFSLNVGSGRSPRFH